MSMSIKLSWCLPAFLGRRSSDSFIPKLLRPALAGLEADGFHPSLAEEIWQQLLAAEQAIRQHVEGLSGAERDAIRKRFVSLGGFGLTGFPSFADVTTPFPLPSIPLPPVKFPPFPAISIPIDTAINATQVLDTAKDKLIGLSIAAFETVKGVVIGMPLEALTVVSKFIDRITAAGELLGKGILDQGIAGLFESVVLLSRDIVAVALATVVNLVVDAVAGVVGGLLLARPLTPGERDFAHRIHHGQINLTHVRVAIFPNAAGLTSANVIYMRSMDLADNFIRGRFAHELTHVRQDQSVFDPATLHAAHEFLNHYLGSKVDRYAITLSDSSTWDSLGVEQQGQLVENYQNHLDGYFPDGELPIPTGELIHYERIVLEEGLF